MGKRPNLAASLKAAAAGERPPTPAQQLERLAEVVTAAPAKEPTKRAPSREGRKAVYAWVDPAMHKQLKLLSIERGESIDALVTEALTAFLKS